MKAITCPQCGGLIRNFLPRQPIVECDYCGAKVIADERFPMLESFDDEAAKFRLLAAPLVRPRPPVQPIFIAISGIGIFIFLVFLLALIPAKSKPAAPLAPEPFKPIISRNIRRPSRKAAKMMAQRKFLAIKASVASLFQSPPNAAFDKNGDASRCVLLAAKINLFCLHS